MIANMLLGPDGKWRTMANERLYASNMALGALYRNALAGELARLGYGIEKTHADGRFEIAGVARETVEALSTRRAEIEAAMEGRGLGTTGENPHLARRAALMTRAAKREVNYAPGDVVAFHRSYKRLGVAKGEERRVAGVDRRNRAVLLEAPGGGTVAWKPSEIGGRQGGTEVYCRESIELRAGDRIRWTRNDKGLGLVNSGAAEVMGIRNGRVTFRLEDGRRLTLTPGDPLLRHLDHAWCSTVHAFQGRTVDRVIAAMEANHPALTSQKAFYVEISRDRAELVTDDAQALKERLEAVTGERISALEGIGEDVRREREAGREAAPDGHERDRREDPATKWIEVERLRDEKAAREKAAPARDRAAPSAPDRDVGREAPQRKAPEPEPPAKSKVREYDLGL